MRFELIEGSQVEIERTFSMRIPLSLFVRLSNHFLNYITYIAEDYNALGLARAPRRKDPQCQSHHMKPGTIRYIGLTVT